MGLDHVCRESIEADSLARTLTGGDQPIVSSQAVCCVEGLAVEDHDVVLQHCAIGWCYVPISNSNLAAELKLETISGIHVMRISGSRVLLIFDSIEIRQQVMSSDIMTHAWSRDNFERLVSQWGSVVLVDEAMLEPSSFEWGRVLVETHVLDRIEERLQLSLKGQIFPIRISEAETFLRGPNCSCDARNPSSSLEDSERVWEDVRSEVGDSIREDPITDGDMANRMVVPPEVSANVGSGNLIEVDQFHEVEMGGVNWRGNGLWDGQSCIPTIDVLVAVVDERAVNRARGCVGPVLEGSNVEVVVSNGQRRKVRLLANVIHSLQLLEERLLAQKVSRGRPRKEDFVALEIADIALRDSELKHSLAKLDEDLRCKLELTFTEDEVWAVNQNGSYQKV
ncbi:hypothetical protein V6N12_010345 [Hibiscus sabdariffa]|uniref:DUF4283 domain-containing protein n=1 Tax=Hibiscus sabdariffa TaxID=183260 RepID=A0ABR2EJT7_9ROSI